MELYEEIGESIPAVIALPDGSTAPGGYSKIIEITKILQLGLPMLNINTSGWFDRICLRNKLKTAVYTKMQVASAEDVDNEVNWNRLSQQEKSIAAHWFLVAKESFLLEINNSLRYWTIQANEYRTWTMEARSVRLNLMEGIVYLRVHDLGYAKDILSDLSQISKDTVIDVNDITKKLNNKIRLKRMTRMYINGLESVENDGVVAIKDYVDETPNTPFANGNGFRGLDASKFREGHTPDSVADELILVIEGKY